MEGRLFFCILTLYLCCVTSQGLKFFSFVFFRTISIKKIVLLKNLHTSTRDWKDMGCSLPAATKLWPRLCFYSCLWFCPQWGGVCLSACWDTTPPGADTPRSRHPLEQTPPGACTPRSRHPPEQTPPGSRHPPRSRHLSQGADPPGADTHPCKQTPPGSRHPREQTPQSRHTPGSRHPPPPEQTPHTPWSRHPPPADPPWKADSSIRSWPAGTHPTGMHSCFFSFFKK